MATKKTTPKKSSTPKKKTSLIKRVVEKIIKPKNSPAPLVSVPKVETKSIDYDVVITNLCGNHKSSASKEELLSVGFSASELPAVGQRKEFGRFTLVHISQDGFLIQ